jgi:hypothetical protein
MPFNRVSKKPEGQPTRGKTASNRLRCVDNFILLYEPSLLTGTEGLCGREPAVIHTRERGASIAQVAHQGVLIWKMGREMEQI